MGESSLDSLRDPTLYPHPAGPFSLIETHISWVLLTGQFAYKRKKPVDLGFVDFTDPALRRRYCHEELRLNRRLAPTVYLDVWAITGSEDRPVLAPDTSPDQPAPAGAFDYLVRMRQFRQEDLLDRLQERQALRADHVDDLAGIIAAFHLAGEPGDTVSACGRPQSILDWAVQNFDQSEPLVTGDTAAASLHRLRCWTRDAFDRLAGKFSDRKAQGFVRDCHGDLHLGNIALVDDEITVFDCIEFNRELRVIDVISEVAFLYMDLLSRNEWALGWRFLDRYLAATGDYAGLDLLLFYAVYRAMVRAKVELIRLRQENGDDPEAERLSAHFRSHLTLAEQLSAKRLPRLMLTRGFSGSGKSTLASKLLEGCGAIRLRSDIERKRLFGLPRDHQGRSLPGEGIYSVHAGQRTYEHLAGLAQSVLDAGYPVIVDATFLKSEQRQAFRVLAERCGVPFHILDLTADREVLVRRIRHRLEKGRDPSEADVRVLERQLASAEPLTGPESAFSITVDGNDGGIDAALPGLLQILDCRAGAT